MEHTDCGGLLFLQPLLARLGLPHWLPADAPRFAALVLRAALLRQRVPAGDPAWWLAYVPTPNINASSTGSASRRAQPATRQACG